MKLLTRIILILVLSWILSPTGWAKTDVKEAVVKIFTDRDRYDYEKPWQKMRIENATGSGFIISGKRILTNAHVVADEDFIQVRKAGDAKKYIAEVEAESHQSDLATLKICEDGFISDLYNLKVAEDAFFSGVNPIELGNSAKIGDRVTIYGFPRGGEELSIKEAQIYRIEHAIYSHPFGHSLLYKIDKPIIGGNSGGPVLKDNRLVGVAFQSGTT